MIPRTKLIDRIKDAPGTHWVLEAGAGFGKTVLIEQVRSAWVEPLLIVRGPVTAADLPAFLGAVADAAYRSGRRALGESLAGAESASVVFGLLHDHSCSLALDDLHRWDEDISDYILELVSEAHRVESAATIFVATRRLPPQMSRIRTDRSWSTIGAEDLALRPEQVTAELASNGLPQPHLGQILHELTAGWPIAVASACARMRQSSDPTELLRQMGQHNSIVEGLLLDSLSQLDPEDIQAASTLTTLPFFDETICAMVSDPGLIDRLLASGLPITRQADGWSTIAEAFRPALVDALPPRLTREPIEYLVQRGELHAAINVCLSVGNPEGAARIIASLDFEQEARLDPSILNAAMTTIGDVAKVYPRSLLVQAQVNASFGRFDTAVGVIDRAAAIFEETDPDLTQDAHIELLLELGLWRMYEGRADETHEILKRCEAAVEPNEQGMTRARLLDLRGMVSQMDGSEAGLNEARGHLTEALAIWRRLQQPRAAAVTAFRLSASVLFRLGQRQEALDLLDSLPSVGSMTLVNKARLGLERSVALPYLGRAAEVPEALAETRQIAGLLGHEWILAWAHWTEIVAASFEGDGERVLRLVEEYLDRNYLLSNSMTQGGMWAETAQALARCGHLQQAEACLERARSAEGLPAQFVRYAEVYVAAHAGDPSQTLRDIDDIRENGLVEIDKRWSLALLEGLCHLRLDDHGQAIKLRDTAREEARELGQPSLPLFSEGAILNRISSGPAHAPTDPTSEEVDAVEVSLFEQFSLSINGQSVPVPTGMVSTLLKVLVLLGGRAVLDQVIDPLWAEADLELGRRRLRNVIRRVRQSCGDILERSGDTISFADGVGSDWLRAVSAADAALANPAIDTIAAAVRANDRPLLPDDRYEEWAETARDEHRERLVRLHDLHAELAEASGNVELAVDALEAAQEHTLFGQDRIRRACALLRSVERTAAATALAQRHELQ